MIARHCEPANCHPERSYVIPTERQRVEGPAEQHRVAIPYSKLSEAKSRRAGVESSSEFILSLPKECWTFANRYMLNAVRDASDQRRNTID